MEPSSSPTPQLPSESARPVGMERPQRLISTRDSRVRKDGAMVQRFFRSFTLLAGAVAFGGMLALSVMALVSARSLARFDPVHRHASQLQQLRRVEERILRALLRGLEGPPAKNGTLSDAAETLDHLVDSDGYLLPETGQRLREASELLSGSTVSELTPLTALREIETALEGEMSAHEDLLARVEEDTRIELLLSGALVLAVPLVGLVLSLLLRRRFLLPLDKLRELMGLLGQKEYRTVGTEGLDPLLRPVFDNFNHMTTRLLELERQHRKRQETLEQEVHAATSALLQQERELARSERLAALGELAAGVAHELRNPLAGIQMAVGGVSKEISDAEHRSRLDLAVAELRRVTRLLNDLLDAARPTPEPSKTFSIAPTVDEFLGLARYQVPANIRIRQEVPADLECRLPEGGLRQALWNLVLNAAQAIGDEPGEIVVKAAGDDGGIRLSVTDDGPGFPEEILRDGARSFATLREGGTGLGLATVRRFAQDLGGELALANVAPHGARVLLRLPCQETP